MSSHDLTDAQWAVIEPRLPKRQWRRGRPRNDDRRTVNGMLSVLKTGCAWSDLPKADGSAGACWRRLRDWSRAGTWERIWRTLLSHLDAAGDLDWSRAFVDGSFVPAKKGAMAEAQRRLAKARRSWWRSMIPGCRLAGP